MSKKQLADLIRYMEKVANSEGERPGHYVFGDINEKGQRFSHYSENWITQKQYERERVRRNKAARQNIREAERHIFDEEFKDQQMLEAFRVGKTIGQVHEAVVANTIQEKASTLLPMQTQPGKVAVKVIEYVLEHVKKNVVKKIGNPYGVAMIWYRDKDDESLFHFEAKRYGKTIVDVKLAENELVLGTRASIESEIEGQVNAITQPEILRGSVPKV